MKELLRTSNPVQLSFIEALLADSGIDCLVLDTHIGAVTIGVIPPRIMVEDEDLDRARRILREAGETPS